LIGFQKKYNLKYKNQTRRQKEKIRKRTKKQWENKETIEKSF
jgi:hypothetical protein